jgi:hypothetical protein
MKRSGFVMLLVLTLVVSLPAWAEKNAGSGSFPYPGPPAPVDPRDFQTNAHQTCVSIGGVLFTDIGFIPLGPTGTNLGQAYGDLQGPLAATILGQDYRGGYDVQHYWISTSGDLIYFKQGWLKPSAVTPLMGPNANKVDQTLAAVRWGDYLVEWDGGTGKFANSKGYVDCFGEADFVNLTLVLRYRGMICHEK